MVFFHTDGSYAGALLISRPTKVSFLAGWLVFVPLLAFASLQVAESDLPELVKRGETVYINNCIGCHGEAGDGKGVAAYGLNPKPRDLTSGIFKFRSTPTGSLPTDDDLLRTIRNGLYGTAMPAFRLMSESDILAVIQYIKSFSAQWDNKYMYEHPVELKNPPRWFSKPIKKKEKHIDAGKALFQMYCVSCHGENGSGHGPAVESMTDDWGYPIVPADLRKASIKQGRSLHHVYRTVMTGLNGVPMPSFNDSATNEQLWEIVTYVEYLRSEHKKNQPPRMVV